MKRPVSAKELVKFLDEVEKIPPQVRKLQAEESFKQHKAKFWTLLKTDEKGEVKKFGQDDWDRIMGKTKG